MLTRVDKETLVVLAKMHYPRRVGCKAFYRRSSSRVRSQGHTPSDVLLRARLRARRFREGVRIDYFVNHSYV